MKQYREPRAETYLEIKLWVLRYQGYILKSRWSTPHHLPGGCTLDDIHVCAKYICWGQYRGKRRGKLNTGFWLANGQNTGFWLVNGQNTCLSLVKILNSVQTAAASLTCCSCAAVSLWPLIGQYWSHDLNTGLWLVNTGHVTWILDCDW